MTVRLGAQPQRPLADRADVQSRSVTSSGLRGGGARKRNTVRAIPDPCDLRIVQAVEGVGSRLLTSIRCPEATRGCATPRERLASPLIASLRSGSFGHDGDVACKQAVEINGNHEEQGLQSLDDAAPDRCVRYACRGLPLVDVARGDWRDYGAAVPTDCNTVRCNRRSHVGTLRMATCSRPAGGAMLELRILLEGKHERRLSGVR